MGRARDVPLNAGMTLAQAGARTVAVRAEELFDAAHGVLDLDDIERVHAMRVATRRLRAVLEIFAPCFPKAEHRAVLREVKALADALGHRRDPDVQLDALMAIADRMGAEERPGLEVFADRLRAERLRANDHLA